MYAVVKVNHMESFEVEVSVVMFENYLNAQDFIRKDWEEEYNCKLEDGVYEEGCYYAESYARLTNTEYETIEWVIEEPFKGKE